MNKSEEAFKWIIGIINSNNIPYRISGGLAANAYGSKRELADIDIDLPEEFFETVLNGIREHLVYGPSQHTDENWDLYLATLDYKGQLIDLSGSNNAKIFDINNQVWVNFEVDFNKVNPLELFGIMVPVITKEDLIRYKSQLKRDVDIIDVSDLCNK